MEAETMDGFTQTRAQAIFDVEFGRVSRRTDLLFAALILLQWTAGIGCALWLSPYTWVGADRFLHTHVPVAVGLGAAISLLPLVLVWRRPGHQANRYVLATAQMLWSAMLIHLTGGRLETHFHIFGSLAFLAFYRDWTVLVPATLITALDHFLRGIYWPESVYGVADPAWWRFLEHAGWVLVIDVFLIKNTIDGQADVKRLADRQADLEATADALAVSGEELEERVADRTRELRVARTEMLEVSRNAGMAEIANGVLHNVGNVLTSVNIAAQSVSDRLAERRTSGIARVAGLVEAHSAGAERLKLVPDYLRTTARKLDEEAAAAMAELETLQERIDHIRAIIMTQQRYAGRRGIVEPVDIGHLIETAIELLADSYVRHDIEVVLMLDHAESVSANRHMLLQVLVNLLSNAKRALIDSDQANRRLAVEVLAVHSTLTIRVTDNGVGILAENLARIFEHGFTTRGDGHGFGLHSSANAAREAGGQLTGHSDGPGSGAVFTLELPLAAKTEVAA
ncbi:MAG: two-component system sensor histidine kinase HydH [Myxococcota bacterium]|jgi:two-component system sensor histidine kinase HydH